MDDQTSWYLVGVVIAVSICVSVLLSYRNAASKINKNPLLANVKYKKLKPESQTRQRLAKSAELFAEGWKRLQSGLPGDHVSCLQCFAKAVEIDEMACGWRTKFEQRLELIGDLFCMDLSNQSDLYHSMLAEAYLVLLLYTVVELYGKPSPDIEEDYRVVKSRMDECVRLQPQNPIAFKLRAEWCLRFETLADVEACTRDFHKAIRLAEADPDGSNISAHGVDPLIQRSYILAFCHYKLGGLMQRKHDFEAARHHYQQVLRHADADLVQLPDTCFSLSVLTMLAVEPDEDRLAALSLAIRYYKSGCEAAKKLKRWLPASLGYEATQALAKGLLPKFKKASQEAEAAQKTNWKQDKDK